MTTTPEQAVIQAAKALLSEACEYCGVDAPPGHALEPFGEGTEGWQVAMHLAHRLAHSQPASEGELDSYEKFDGIGPHSETIETRARIGERYLEAYESALDDPRLKGYTPADCPSELLLDLLHTYWLAPKQVAPEELWEASQALIDAIDSVDDDADYTKEEWAALGSAKLHAEDRIRAALEAQPLTEPQRLGQEGEAEERFNALVAEIEADPNHPDRAYLDKLPDVVRAALSTPAQAEPVADPGPGLWVPGEQLIEARDALVRAADTERAAIVAYIRELAQVAFVGESADGMLALDRAGDAIEQGLHLRAQALADLAERNAE